VITSLIIFFASKNERSLQRHLGLERTDAGGGAERI
jgi:hypothetical protein